MNGGDENMRGRFTCELDDQLGQIGLNGLDAMSFESLVEFDLVSGERFDLDDFACVMAY